MPQIPSRLPSESTKFKVQITVQGTQELWTLFSDTATCCTFIHVFVTKSVIPWYAHPDSHKLNEVKLSHNHSKPNQIKMKLRVALLILGGAAFLPLPVLAVLLWLVLHFRSCLVWCGFPFFGGVAVSSVLLGSVSLHPSLFWCCLFCLYFFGWVVLLSPPPFGGVASLHFLVLCCHRPLELN